jgi:hypothetical protein
MEDMTDYTSWTALEGKDIKGADGADFGEVKEIGRHYIVAEKGLVSKDRFYFPKYLARGFDGKTLFLNIADSEKDSFKFDSPPSYEDYAVYRTADIPADIETRIVVTKPVVVKVEPARRERTGAPPVSNWDSVVHKNVRSADGEPVGNIVAVSDNSLHVETAGSRSQYMIPKDRVGEFNGAEVILDTPLSDLGQFVLPGP